MYRQPAAPQNQRAMVNQAYPWMNQRVAIPGQAVRQPAGALGALAPVNQPQVGPDVQVSAPQALGYGAPVNQPAPYYGGVPVNQPVPYGGVPVNQAAASQINQIAMQQQALRQQNQMALLQNRQGQAAQMPWSPAQGYAVQGGYGVPVNQPALYGGAPANQMALAQSVGNNRGYSGNGRFML
jgi:hypothetical protein